MDRMLPLTNNPATVPPDVPKHVRCSYTSSDVPFHAPYNAPSPAPATEKMLAETGQVKIAKG